MTARHNRPHDGPVETVDSMLLTGARVMVGTWSCGCREVHIAAQEPLNADDAAHTEVLTA